MSLVEIVFAFFWPLAPLICSVAISQLNSFFVNLFSNCLFYMPGDTKELSEIFDHLKEWKSWAHFEGKQKKVNFPPTAAQMEWSLDAPFRTWKLFDTFFVARQAAFWRAL